jgi:hypothetical protein
MQDYETIEEAISFYSNFYMQSNIEVYVWQIHNRKVTSKLLVTVAERSKACTVFARSEAGTVGSNTTEGMDV